MKLTSLFSGSSGNCILIESGGCRLLIDAGLSGTRIQQMLSYTDVSFDDIDGILVTHEHDDHIAGVGILSRRFSLPIYTNQNTYEAMKTKLGKVKDNCLQIFNSGEAFYLKDLKILPYHTSHDAAESVGFLFDDGHDKTALLTDTGVITEEIKTYVLGSKTVFIESNHDIDMLVCGRYPEPLKQRILSESGHLSNVACASFLKQLIDEGCEHLCLGHLSAENNTPLVALNTAVGYLADSGMKRNGDYTINIARRDGITDSITT